MSSLRAASAAAVLLVGPLAGPLIEAADAATMISMAPPPAAPDTSSSQPPEQDATGGEVPPAAIAGLAGLAVLVAVFRPRRTGLKQSGLPEVSS